MRCSWKKAVLTVAVALLLASFRIGRTSVTALPNNPDAKKIAAAETRIRAIAERSRGLRMVIGCPSKAWGIDAQIADELKRAGVKVLAYPDAPDMTTSGKVFKDSDARRYNVVIFGDSMLQKMLPDPNTGEMPQGIRDQVPVFRHFLQEGGGIWFSSLGEQNWGRSSHSLNYILKELGLDAEVVGEVVKDSADTTIKFRFGPYTWFYAWAEILPDPLTEGLKGLWHPSGITASLGSMGVVPIVRLSSEWRVLVRGMSTAASYGLDLEKSELGHELLSAPGTVKSSPVLCAVREIGKGRVVLWPTWSNFTVTGGSGGMLLDGESDDRRSDGARLIENLLCWLAEPSQGSKTIGQFDPEKERVPPPQYNVDEILKKWARPGRRDYANQYKGLIGARSNLSDGRSSPEEMIAAAKKAGYDFIAFTEDLAKMNETKWKKLLTVCDRVNAADPNFIAYPGLDFLDEAGNRGLHFGQRYWVRDDWWCKKRLGRIKYWRNFTYQADANPRHWFPRVIIRSKTNNKRPWNQGWWSFLGAYCYEGGKLVDDSFHEWRRLIGRHVFFLNTGIMAVHTVHSADEIAASAKQGLYQTYVRAESLSKALARLRGCVGGGGYFGSYISAGPEILDFKVKAVWPGGEGIDVDIPGNDRGLLHLLVRAEAGLKEVAVYDGERLVRCFRPEGKSFERFLTFHPESFHAYSMTVTDVQGRQAVSWNAWMQVQKHIHRRCGDNANWMTTGKCRRGAPSRTPPKPRFNLLELTQGWTSRTIEERETLLRPRYKSEQGYYGHGGLSAAINPYIYPELLVDGEPWDAWRPVATLDFATIGRHGSILTNTVREDYLVRMPAPATTGCFASPYRAVPSPWPADLKQYAIHWKIEGARINRYQGKVTFKRKVSSPDGKPIRLSLGATGKPGANILEVMNADGTSERHEVGDGTVSGEIPAGGYICWYDDKGDGGGGIIALSPGVHYSYRKRHQRCDIYVPSPISPGTEVTWDVIFVAGTPETTNSNAQMEAVRAGMGVSGKPTLYRVQPRVGKVADQKFFLTLEAEDHGFSGKIARTTEKPLPIHLPVMFKGLNPRWDAGIWYRGKNLLETITYYRDGWGGFTWDAMGSYEPRVDDIQYIPVIEGETGYCQVETDKQDADVFIGNLLVSDQPDIFITVIKAAKGKCTFEINNPTDKAITATVRPAKGFDLVGRFAKKVSLPAGGFTTITVLAQ